MTFNPFRSDSDDALDERLNAWARAHDDHTDPASDIADDAIVFHRWADSAQRSDFAATGPAASTWDTVLRQVAKPEKERKHIMSSITYSTPGYAGSVPAVRTTSRSFSSYANIAATVLMVIGLAAGGWFAAMQLNSPGGNDGRFAAVTGTPVAGSQTCDVEPMTVDEVMAIVENPYSVLPDEYIGSVLPADATAIPYQSRGLLEVPVLPNFEIMEMGPHSGVVPDQAQFDEVKRTADQYLACLHSGTAGQIWRFVEPVNLQSFILWQFPVYRTADEVRSYVEFEIDTHPQDPTYVGGNQRFVPNAEITEARVLNFMDSVGIDYDAVVYLGWEAVDRNGNSLATTDFNGDTVAGDEGLSNGTSMVFVHSDSSGKWYLLQYHGMGG